ncbi:hypothetical protein RclHR1_04260007 [Rhizophagus clarus]|uniref:BTB domain-containing protein n=1 Tax=Rhizophagus clarus TaxID=94130 RepID=A0A2Z6SA84_9GLOM|nr:hypothetical protein RclHR1_04260007 [Rhizophagus clarus]GES87638.1 hypothetical protein GLOIN_2v1762916 [Rhizophagus clarus]
MTSTFHLGLSKDFSLILDDADDYNVIIQVGEDLNTKEFRAHSAILRARSPYFKNALSTNWIKWKNNMIMLNKPNLAPTVFDMILKYIYTGELNLTNQSGEDIFKLLIASDELSLEELFEHIQEYLIEKKANWIHENFILVFNTAINLNNCKKLQNYCLESICENPLPFLSSKIFPSLDKEVLFCLVKRDDLQIKEVVIWDYLIKWGIEQTPDLRSKNYDMTEWTSKDYQALRNTLEQFIPFVRFVEISRADFFDKVRPYKAIIPNHIYEEIEEFNYKDVLPKTITLLPRAGSTTKKGKFLSRIIKQNHLKIIVNWIDKKDTTYTHNKKDLGYEFVLNYRGSRDRISNKSFRDKCKGRVASLVLVKIKNTSKIFGGYSSIGFSSLGDDYIIKHGYRFYKSTENFIFSFEHEEDTQNMKISRIINKYEAIMDHGGNGFNFGRGSLSMNDRFLHANNSSKNYENNLNTGTIYTIEEIETFTIDR